MADIELRLGRDMLVLSAPVDVPLERQGIDVARDRQYLNLMEPDAISDALRMELLAGAQCLVTTTEDITGARLAHVRMDGDAAQLAKAAIGIASSLKPQHVLVEIGPCGLPLDVSSKASLNESRSQYAEAARAFEGCEFDAFFLNGFFSIPDMKCALMGVAQVSGKPVFASMVVGERAASARKAPVQATQAEGSPSAGGKDTIFSLEYKPIEGAVAPAVPVPSGSLEPGLWAEAIAAMSDLGASVIGFETADALDAAVSYAKQAADEAGRPVLAQLCVCPDDAALPGARSNARKGLVPLEDRQDYAPETLGHAAMKLHDAGVQFLRATGSATPACTGALAATASGLDVHARC